MKIFSRQSNVLKLTLVAIAAAVMLACTGASNSGAKSTTPQKATAAAAIVNVGDNFYSRSSVTIKKNKRVKFQWVDTDHDHNVTTKSGPSSFHSKTEDGDFLYSKKFTKKGTYKLHCTIHPDSMKVTVRVK